MAAVVVVPVVPRRVRTLPSSEGGAIAPGPALASAVADALKPLGHVVVDELPLTPERVRNWVEQASAAGR